MHGETIGNRDWFAEACRSANSSKNIFRVAVPNDCHKFYQCVRLRTLQFIVEQHDCATKYFDPSRKSCVKKAPPGCPVDATRMYTLPANRS